MKIVIHPHYRRLADFIQRLPECFDLQGEVLYAGRNTVKRYAVDGESLVVKRFKRPNPIQRIVYTFFKKSKAERAYLFAALLRDRGIDTPHEIAYIEMKEHGLLQDTYFISTECKDPEIRDTLRSKDCPATLIQAVAAYLVGLHEKGVMHGDLNLTNILFRGTAEKGYYFTLIDTNRSRFLASPTQADCIRNLRTLTHERDLLRRLLTAYCERRGWDTEDCIRQVVNLLKGMEKRKAAKKKILRRK